MAMRSSSDWRTELVESYADLRPETRSTTFRLHAPACAIEWLWSRQI